MASPYTPQLTAWRAAAGSGVQRDCIEHEGTVYAVQRGKEAGDMAERECVEIGGKVFALVDEKEVAVHGGKVLRCVEFPMSSAAALRLTVTEGAEKEVAEVVEPDGELRVLGCGGCYETVAGTREHVVDVQGGEEAFVLLVSVREEDARILRVQRLN